MASQDLNVIAAIGVMDRLAFQIHACRDQQLGPISQEHQKDFGWRRTQCRHHQAHQDLHHYSGSCHRDPCLVSDYCQVFLLACAVCLDLSRLERILGPLVCIAGMVAFLARQCCLWRAIVSLRSLAMTALATPCHILLLLTNHILSSAADSRRMLGRYASCKDCVP